VVCQLPPHRSNQVQRLDLSPFAIPKRLIARTDQMETATAQSQHIGEVASAFMYASSPLSIAGMFLNFGIARVLRADAKLRCRVRLERARSLLVLVDPVVETAATDEEVEGAETELSVTHFVEFVSEEVITQIE
jgi:hypothetical protein